MLNLFPILWLTPFGHFILRTVVGGILLALAILHIRQFRTFAPKLRLPVIHNGYITLTTFIIVEIVVSVLFILGIWTQLAALLTLSLSLKTLMWHKRFPEGSVYSKSTYLLIFAASLSLLVTGAGPFGYDLPL